MKKAVEYLAEANAVVPRISVEDGIAKHAEGKALFIDVRDGTDIALSGTIAGAMRIPRGFIEFAADDTHALHKPALTKDREFILVCGAGGMAALTGKTLREMGYDKVFNVGGFKDWKMGGGPTEGN